MDYFPRIILENYHDSIIVRDTEGWSPAEVYRVTNKDNVLFLKNSHSKYNETTYNVRREKEIINWLTKNIRVPNIISYEETNEFNSLLMNHVGGISLETIKTSITSEQYIDYHVQAINKLQAVSTINCPFNNCVSNRINELKYLIENDLADIDSENWELETRNRFKNSKELFEYIVNNIPTEDLVFSHGDMTNSNIFIYNEEVGFIDLGRCGLADKWLDIAFCVRDIKESIDDDKYIQMFFEKLNLKPNWEKIEYYILLDELF